MEKIRNCFELALLTCLHIIFSCPIIASCIIGLFAIALPLLLHKPASIAIEEEYEVVFILLGILFYLIYILLKLFLFPILYVFKKQLPLIHSYFKKFVTDKKFALIIILSIFLLDLILFLTPIFVFENIKEISPEDIIFWLFFGGGSLISYAFFALLYTLWKKKF